MNKAKKFSLGKLLDNNKFVLVISLVLAFAIWLGYSMYGGEQKLVEIRFINPLLDAVVDRFGHDTMLIPDGEEHFTFVVEVAVSPMFLSWIIGFGEKAQILYPPQVVEACRALAQTAIDRHSG